MEVPGCRIAAVADIRVVVRRWVWAVAAYPVPVEPVVVWLWEAYRRYQVVQIEPDGVELAQAVARLLFDRQVAVAVPVADAVKAVGACPEEFVTVMEAAPVVAAFARDAAGPVEAAWQESLPVVVASSGERPARSGD